MKSSFHCQPRLCLRGMKTLQFKKTFGTNALVRLKAVSLGKAKNWYNDSSDLACWSRHWPLVISCNCRNRPITNSPGWLHQTLACTHGANPRDICPGSKGWLPKSGHCVKTVSQLENADLPSNDQMYTITVKRESTFNSVFRELGNVFVQLRVP